MEIGPLIKIISHDLRGPLGNLKSVVTLFKSGELDMDQAKQFMQHIEVGVDKSIVMLDDLIEWGQASSRNPKVDADDGLDVNPLIEEVVELMSEQASTKDISLKFNDSKLPKADYGRNALKLILKNLISNAIKFTEPGGDIVIHADVDSDVIYVSVSDNGIGVPDEMADAIFGLSKDNRRIGTNDEKGPGIGLFICRDLATRNKSRIILDKKPEGKGSVFKVTLPLYK